MDHSREIYILPTEGYGKKIQTNIQDDCCIIVYLYYLEDVEKYLCYLNNVPAEIKILFFSSRNEVIDKIKDLVDSSKYLSRHYRDNIFYSIKENRGRDLSTLLVAAKSFVLDNKYFCFVHDKRPIYPHLEEDTNLWCDGMWTNLLGNEGYIEALLEKFEKEKIGIALPPLPMGEILDFWYGETWDLNKDNTIRLCKELGVDDKSLFEKMPMSLGSCFWARTDAVINIFNKEWKYSDFPDEPMAYDGTISHAIERSFEFVAKYNGFSAVTIMNDQYASSALVRAQEYCRMMFSQLSKRENVFAMKHIRNMDNNDSELRNYLFGKKDVYIYGAGIRGKSYLNYLKRNGYIIKGFIVTQKGENTNILGLPVFEINEISNFDDVGIIVAAAYETQIEMIRELTRLGYDDYYLGYR